MDEKIIGLEKNKDIDRRLEETTKELQREREKLMAVIRMSGDLIFEYDIAKDQMHYAYRDHRGAHCAPAIFITECTINHICRAGCPHPAAERHHKIVPPAHVTAHPTGRCKHRPLQISFSVRGKILPFFPFNTFSSSSSYKKRAQRR